MIWRILLFLLSSGWTFARGFIPLLGNLELGGFVLVWERARRSCVSRCPPWPLEERCLHPAADRAEGEADRSCCCCCGLPGTGLRSAQVRFKLGAAAEMGVSAAPQGAIVLSAPVQSSLCSKSLFQSRPCGFIYPACSEQSSPKQIHFLCLML